MIIVHIVSFIALSIVALIILIDIFPMFKDWLSRIHIGRFRDENIWNQTIVNKGSIWLNKTPKIKVTDNTRFVVLDIINKNYTKNSIQYWQEASLILGMSEYIKNRNDKESKNKMMKFLNSKFDNNGQWLKKPEHVDAAILAYAVIKLDFIDTDQYKNAFDYTWEMIKEHIGYDDTVRYRKSMQSYRYVDTIGFICPFLVSYGIKYNKTECIDLAVKQIKEYEKYGILAQHSLPCHAYKIETKEPIGLYGWGRGLGWFAIGLIDAWNELPEENIYKTTLEESVKKFAKATMEFQQDNGSWNWTVNRVECRPDSSTTATLGWFMLNAAKIDDISGACLGSADKAINFLMNVTRRNGAVDFSQGDTKDIGVYSMLFNILPFTQGFCIRMINLKLSI